MVVGNDSQIGQRWTGGDAGPSAASVDGPIEEEDRQGRTQTRSRRRTTRSPTPTARGEHRSKRRHLGTVAADGPGAGEVHIGTELSLQVKWTSITGKIKVTTLPMAFMPQGVDDMTGLHKRLITRVFSDTERPASLNDAQYLKFNTCDECLNYPQDVAQTSFKVIAEHEGWQYVIYETAANAVPAGSDFVHVVSVEFETMARVMGQLGIRMHMIAYPIVAVNKAKLLDLIHQLQTDPNFRGIM